MTNDKEKIKAALDRLEIKQMIPELNPNKTIEFIKTTVSEIDRRLGIFVGQEEFYRGSGAVIPVHVVRNVDNNEALTTFDVTSQLSVDKKVKVGKPTYTEEEIVAKIVAAFTVN